MHSRKIAITGSKPGVRAISDMVERNNQLVTEAQRRRSIEQQIGRLLNSTVLTKEIRETLSLLKSSYCEFPKLEKNSLKIDLDLDL